MAHLATVLAFIMLLLAAGGGIALMLRENMDLILAALAPAEPAPPARAWQTRVRMVSAPRPAAVRLAARRAVA